MKIRRLLLLLAALALLPIGCGTPKAKPRAWSVSISKQTPASIEVDLIGITEMERPAWEGYDIDKYWKPGDLRRANADKLFCVTLCGAQIGAKTWTNGLIQPLDQGDFDNRAFLATLREIGYKGPVGVMCYGIPGDAREHLARSIAAWKKFSAE